MWLQKEIFPCELVSSSGVTLVSCRRNLKKISRARCATFESEEDKQDSSDKIFSKSGMKTLEKFVTLLTQKELKPDKIFQIRLWVEMEIWRNRTKVSCEKIAWMVWQVCKRIIDQK